jgi:DNA-binding SARP family transcriptional activator
MLQSRARVHVSTLGGFRVVVDGCIVEDAAWRRRSARQLFKVLVTHFGRHVCRDEVIELFWPDSDGDAAASNLRSTLHAVRQALNPARLAPAPEVVFGDHTSLWLDAESNLSTDALAFEELVAAARRSRDPLPLLAQASTLYAGDYLPDDMYEDWATERRDALRRTWTELEFGLAQALEARADLNGALQPLDRLLRADRCDERAAQELMRLLTRFGRRAEALRVFERLTRSLYDELDVTPSRETLALHRQISGRESTAPPSALADVATFHCSYPFPSPTDLVGRESQVAVLHQILAAGRTAGKVAFVSAPAGIGKSALVGHVVRQAEAAGVLCLAGGCYAERGGVPFGPFHDALADYLLAQSPDHLRHQFAAGVDDLAGVIPELRYHLQIDTAPTRLDRASALGAIHACLRSLAERAPVLVCLEDLHAADEPTVQTLHYLARQTRRLPIVFLATYRDEESGADQLLGQTVTAMLRERLAERLTLAPLSRDASDRLAARLLDGTTGQALGEMLYAASAGNPLFVEELVLALLNADQLERKADEWCLAGDVQGRPHIVHEFIAQRLQQLDPDCLDVLEMASVLGESCEYAVLLAAVEPLDESTLLSFVDQAIDAHVLQPWSGGYAFRHALTRDAVYWGMSAPRRKLLHAWAGDVLERAHADVVDDHASQLAYHFSLAGESRAVRIKALRYSLAAGRRAIALASYAEALEHFERATRLIDADTDLADVDERARALCGRGLAEANMARYHDSVGSFRAALAMMRDPVERGQARRTIAYSLARGGALRELLDECEAGMDEVKGVRSPPATDIRATLLQLIGWTMYRAGRFSEAIRIGDRIQKESAPDEHGPRMLAHRVIASGYLGLGRIHESIRHAELSIAEAEANGDRVMLAVSFEFLGRVDYAGGHFATARKHLAHALELYRESTDEQRGLWALRVLCRVWIAEGDHKRAHAQIVKVLKEKRASNEPFEGDAHYLLGLTQSFRGEWEAARESFEHAIRVASGLGDVLTRINATVELGFVDQCVGRLSRAETHYLEAAELTSEMDPCPHRVLALRHLGRVRLMLRGPVAATADIAEAVREVKGMPESLEFAPTLVALAELRAEEGSLDEARALAQTALETARPIADRIEAHLILARANLGLGCMPPAVSHAREAVAQAETLQAPLLLAAAYRGLADAARRHDTSPAPA